MELPPEYKVLFDMGLGAVSLLLWLRQGKVNKQQMELDAKQNKVTEDLTTMVKDHDVRIARLEHAKKPRRRLVPRARMRGR